MSELTSKTQTRVRVEGTDLRVTHVETSLDDVLSVLADERRRQSLVVICECSDPMDVSMLAERVADRLASDATVDRLRASLYHRHLPKIESAGLVEYDPENRLVEATDAIEA